MPVVTMSLLPVARQKGVEVSCRTHTANSERLCLLALCGGRFGKRFLHSPSLAVEMFLVGKPAGYLSRVQVQLHSLPGNVSSGQSLNCGQSWGGYPPPPRNAVLCHSAAGSESRAVGFKPWWGHAGSAPISFITTQNRGLEGKWKNGTQFTMGPSSLSLGQIKELCSMEVRVFSSDCVTDIC